MGRNVSALIGKSVQHIPEKCKDPGTFCIPCIIGNSKFENSMLDLGVAINALAQIDKLKSDAKYYVWDDPYLLDLQN
uniref:Uncharacterized protein n=1 Tax=Cajanus cajan TaxID=3821 RepID=A0A151R2U0_CAJCA|nr:hypothetical protein KK1_041963 [Cajanus cajan]